MQYTWRKKLGHWHAKVLLLLSELGPAVEYGLESCLAVLCDGSNLLIVVLSQGQRPDQVSAHTVLSEGHGHEQGSSHVFWSAPATRRKGDCCSVARSCPTLCDPMHCCTPGFPVLYYLLELAQTHVRWVDDAFQPSHPLSSPLLLASYKCFRIYWNISYHTDMRVEKRF